MKAVRVTARKGSRKVSREMAEETAQRAARAPLKGRAAAEAERWMREAAKVAEGALCLRARCGAVIVKGGAIIGRGYNAPPRDRVADRLCEAELPPGKPRYDRTCCVHAEWRAILDAARRAPAALAGSTLYSARVDQSGAIVKSGEPFCTVCSRLALDSGVAAFALWHERGIVEYPTREYNRLSYAYRDQK